VKRAPLAAIREEGTEPRLDRLEREIAELREEVRYLRDEFGEKPGLR
jgi:hypothetical protein